MKRYRVIYLRKRLVVSSEIFSSARLGERAEWWNEIGENVSPILPFSHHDLGLNCVAGPAFEEYPSSTYGGAIRGNVVSHSTTATPAIGVTVRNVPLIAYSLAIG